MEWPVEHNRLQDDDDDYYYYYYYDDEPTFEVQLWQASTQWDNIVQTALLKWTSYSVLQATHPDAL